jgi:chromosome segregation ATPase
MMLSQRMGETFEGRPRKGNLCTRGIRRRALCPATELINQLKDTHHRIEKKRAEIETSAVEEIQQEQAEIDAEIVKLEDRLAELDRKLNPEAGAKAS